MKLLITIVLFVPTLLWAGETITLTQTACQFIEPEHGDQHYQANSYTACESLNHNTEDKRLEKAKVLKLKAGEYTFHVINKDVPYVLGFWLRGSGFSRLTLPSVSGGGIQTGGSKDYRIKLSKGEYVYSCPLNPTPDYKLIVE